MNTNKFHLESPTVSVRDRFIDRVIDLDDREKDKITNLLLRLFWHNSITETDSSYLMNTADRFKELFIIKDREFIYPENEPLFPFEIIESSVKQCGTALITHLYEHQSNNQNVKTKIITAPILLMPKHDIIIGCTFPLSYNSDTVETDFQNFVFKIQSTLPVVSETIDKLKRYTKDSTPSLIVEQSENSIITINRSMRNLIGKDETTFIGRKFELTDFPELLKLDGQLKFIKLDNNSKINVIQFIESVPPLKEDHNSLCQKIKSGTGNIILAVTHLNETAPSNDESESYCRSVILNEAVRVNNLVNLHNLISRLELSEKIDLDPVKLIEQIILKARNAHDAPIKFVKTDSSIIVRGQYEIYQRIFEMIIDFYSEISDSNQIKIKTVKANHNLIISINTKMSESINDFQISELANIKYLCEILDIKIENSSSKKKEFSTTLTIEKE